MLGEEWLTGPQGQIQQHTTTKTGLSTGQNTKTQAAVPYGEEGSALQRGDQMTTQWMHLHIDSCGGNALQTCPATRRQHHYPRLLISFRSGRCLNLPSAQALWAQSVPVFPWRHKCLCSFGFRSQSFKWKSPKLTLALKIFPTTDYTSEQSAFSCYAKVQKL